jgi:predicted nucleic acid-binding protein
VRARPVHAASRAPIAEQAFSRNLILATANTREFDRVKGLIVEDVEDWTL